MNKEALVREINGQTARLLDTYTKKDLAAKGVQQQEREIAEYDIIIREVRGILETLQFTLQTEGFVNLPEKKDPVEMPAHTKMDEVTKALMRGD